ncbi:olfactory receptor 14A16-like [Talpa occidentalis]|uniref:olfactory receptor 14A16-like n=1 Tax=Talpa occidentalis TaxID=50954 RepID=UPI00188E0F2D|nr:olfactory receptor 14A16-like [Talpa occidentalis]
MVAGTGNILIITATSMDNSLQSPMYFFLKHLSFLDLCYISVTVPRSIYNSFMHNGFISLWECMVQCFAFVLCAAAEMSMLTVMSYDRYVAICLPLHYETIMDVHTCVLGILGVWISGVISGTMHTAAIFSMHFCGSHIIHQFFCDVPHLTILSCSNEYINDIGISAFLDVLYDRYLAIYLPLYYEIIMDASTCVRGVVGVWISGVISSVMHTIATFSMHFCGSRIIHQFFYDIPQLLKISCSNEYTSKVGVTDLLSILAFLCVTLIGLSYIQIFSTVLRMPSPEGRAKAFSICLLHRAVVILFISTCGIEFFQPPSDSPSTLDIFLSIMYTVLPPTLNAMIYSLRNRAIKAALRKAVRKRKAEFFS